MKFSFFVKKTLSILILSATLFVSTQKTWSYVCIFKEDFYRLYHVHHSVTAEDCIENLYYLERAAKADFANPLYAFVRINDEAEWEKYRYLFQMHINLKLIEQHIKIAALFDRKMIRFYDAPYKDEYLRNLQTAKKYYETCYPYWEEAMLWAEKASTGNFKFLFITGLQNWEDERDRITTKALDYKKTLDRELSRVNKNIEKLEAFPSYDY